MRLLLIAVLGFVVLAAVVAVVVAASFWWLIRLRKVGPDADRMAEDPVLHIAIEGACGHDPDEDRF